MSKWTKREIGTVKSYIDHVRLLQADLWWMKDDPRSAAKDAVGANLLGAAVLGSEIMIGNRSDYMQSYKTTADHYSQAGPMPDPMLHERFTTLHAEMTKQHNWHASLRKKLVEHGLPAEIEKGVPE